MIVILNSRAMTLSLVLCSRKGDEVESANNTVQHINVTFHILDLRPLGDSRAAGWENTHKIAC